jgi:hypothetical protein
MEKWVCFCWFIYYTSQLSLLVTIFVLSSQMEAHPGWDINEYMGYALAHKGRAKDLSNVYDLAKGPEAYTNPNVYEKLAQYTAAARMCHGPDFDPTTAPRP